MITRRELLRAGIAGGSAVTAWSLASGRLVRPEQEPHLEIGCGAQAGAVLIASDLATLGVTAVVRRRRNRWLVTVRSTAQVGAALSSIGAQSGRLEFEAGRVMREVRATVNRRLNAETANLRRTASAGEGLGVDEEELKLLGLLAPSTHLGQVLNTGGVDPGSCTLASEGHDWVRLHGHN